MKMMQFKVGLGLVGLCFALSAGSGELPPDWAAARDWLLPAAEGNAVVIRDFLGNDLLKLDGATLAYPYIGDKTNWTREYGRYEAKVKTVKQLGPGLVRVEYALNDPGIKDHYALIVSEGGPRLRMEQRVVLKAGAPQLGTVSGGAVFQNRIRFRLLGACRPGAAFCQGGAWVKPQAGEAYEAGGVKLAPFETPAGRLYLGYDGIGAFQGKPREEFNLVYHANDVAEALRDARLTAEDAKGAIMPATGEYFAQVHGKASEKASDAAPVAAASGERAYSNVIKMYLLPWKDSAFVASALQSGAALAASISTGRDFNLFDSSREAPAFDVMMMNPKCTTNEVDCRIVARNYDGRKAVDETFRLKLAPYEAVVRRFALPKRMREYWFVNAAFDDGRTNSFVRADVATIEPYRYKSLETSVMGIAASFDIPSAEACDRLLTRMGARWIRTYGGTEKYAANGRCGILGFHLDGKATNEVQRLAFATKKLEEAAARDCPIVEVGNELNFGLGYEAALKRAEWYRDWLKAFHDARAKLKLEGKIKISTFGFAGCIDGGAFYGAMEKTGCWDYCDILSLHPGRLNQTPDNQGPDWQWNYLPQIRTTKKFMARIRDRRPLDLILTEVYARTPPNKDDSDSTRAAAESVILSCALAKIEGVTALNWYQLHDSLHYDVGGINEHNTEYHYGLLRRDGTVKPSLLAFCTISEALDGAEFVREVAYADDRKAWFFETPRGPMAILLDRKDGYYPYDGMFTGRPFTGHLEPWLDHWRSRTDYAFDAPKGSVVVRDTIGRSRKVKADKNGRVTLTLSGAPLIVYGLGLPASDEALSALALGLVSAGGATGEEIRAFARAGGSFAFDAPGAKGLAAYAYRPLDRQVTADEAEGELRRLFAEKVQRLVFGIHVADGPRKPGESVEACRKAQAGAFAARLAPYAAARRKRPKETPEVYVWPSGQEWVAMENGVKELADGFAYVWEPSCRSAPRDLFGGLRWRMERWRLPALAANIGPVGYEAFKGGARAEELADAQFFGMLFELGLLRGCRAIALTTLRDLPKAPPPHSLGETSFAASVTGNLDRYATACGLFDATGRAKPRLDALRVVREWTADVRDPECSVYRSGLRTIRFRKGNVPCAVVWQGDCNRLSREAIDDLSGREMARKATLEVCAARGGLRVLDIYGNNLPVEVKNGTTLLSVGDVPRILTGVRVIAERRRK